MFMTFRIGISWSDGLFTNKFFFSLLKQVRDLLASLLLLLLLLFLSVGFETNLDNNAARKFSKYRYLLNDLTSKYRHVEFVNLSIGSLGIFGQSCDSFIQMCSDLSIDKAHTNYIITKLSTIIIRTTYYIFCMRDKPWTNPDLLSY